MKNWHALIASLMVVALVVACAPAPTVTPTAAPQPTKAQAPTQAPPAKVKITFWQWGSEDQKFPDGDLIGDWYRKNVIQPFMDKNPNIEVDFAMKGYESSGTTLWLDTALAAGSPPDVVFDAVFRIAKYAQKGLMMPLDGILTAEKKAQLDASYLATVELGGHYWAIPIDNSFPDALILNKKAFEEAGIANLLPRDPDRDWTTEEFEQALKALTKAPDRYGTLFWAKTPSYDHATTVAWLSAFGCEMFKNGDHSKVAINCPECVAGMKWMKSLIDKGYVVPGPAGLTDDDLDAYLLSGRIAIGSGGWYELGLVQSGKKDGSLKIDFEPYMVNYPHLPGQKPGKLANLGGRVIAAFKPKTADAAKQEAILKFIDYISAPDTMTKTVAKFAGGLAGFPLLAKIDVGKLYPGNADFAWIARMQSERGTTDYGWTANNFTEIRSEWAKARQGMWGGDVTIEKGLADFEAKANQLLKTAP
jgi:ABC-type glycerol-3-phosphate transport system substrate-binding protein